MASPDCIRGTRRNKHGLVHDVYGSSLNLQLETLMFQEASRIAHAH